MLAGKPAFWSIFIVAMFTWPILRSLHAERDLSREHRRVLGEVRDFTLRDDRGGELGSAELRGRVWVASFAVIECKPTCSASEHVLTKMAELRHRTRNLGDAIRLVTFPLDPDRASATRLNELSATYRSGRGTWRFVSGPPAEVAAVLGSFHVTERMTATHLALVDANMQIRGSYDIADEAALPLLLRDVSLLLAPGGQL